MVSRATPDIRDRHYMEKLRFLKQRVYVQNGVLCEFVQKGGPRQVRSGHKSQELS
jgi:hypothetical protein